MTTEVPKIRASWTRMLVDAYRRTLSPEVFDRAMARVDRDLLAALDASGPFDFLDARIHLAVVEGPWPLLRPDEFRDVWRRHILDSFERPIFRGLIQGALRLFQHDPLSLMRVVPNGWSLVSRGVGEFLVERDSGSPSGRVRLVGLPAGYRQSEAFALAWAATIDAFVVLADVRGDVRVDMARAAQGEFLYSVRWAARAAVG